MALALTLALMDEAGAAPIRTKLLSYNLHHGEGTDGKLDLARIGGIIKSVAPDYAGLQEIDSMVTRTGKVDQPAEYARLTGLRSLFGKAIPLEGGGYGNTALSKLPMKNAQRLALPGEEPRMALFTDIDLSGGANPAEGTVTFIDTHLMVGDGDAALASAKLINAYVRDPAHGDTSRPMILLGDMNSGRGSAAIAEFLKAWKADGFNYGIDWVFFRPAGRWAFVKAGKLTDGAAAIASDHEPVTQEMDLLIANVGLRPITSTEAGGTMGTLRLNHGVVSWAAPRQGTEARGFADARGRLAPEPILRWSPGK